jgi:hypothetical protein
MMAGSRPAMTTGTSIQHQKGTSRFRPYRCEERCGEAISLSMRINLGIASSRSLLAMTLGRSGASMIPGTAPVAGLEGRVFARICT